MDAQSTPTYAVLTEFGRVFWRGMTLAEAVASARRLEPFYGAYTVCRDAGAAHGARVPVGQRVEGDW